MIYVLLITLGVLLLQHFLARNPIAGLIIPMAAIMGLLMALLMVFSREGTGWSDPVNRLSILLFLLISTASLLQYFRQRQKEYRAGYLNEDAASFKETNHSQDTDQGP